MIAGRIVDTCDDSDERTVPSATPHAAICSHRILSPASVGTSSLIRARGVSLDSPLQIMYALRPPKQSPASSLPVARRARTPSGPLRKTATALTVVPCTRSRKGSDPMSVHLVNPSDNSFGTAVITPRWLFVLAAATPASAGDPILVDELLEPIDPVTLHPGDIVGISVHTGNALRGYEVGRMARQRGAWVVYGGTHATLYPEEAFGRGHAHSVVTGDGDLVWASAVNDCLAGSPRKIYEGGRISGDDFLPARCDLMQTDKYM